VLSDIQERGRLLAVGLLLDGLRHERPQLVHVHNRAVELIHGLVEVAHTDLAEVPWMVLVEENAVVVHTSGVTAPSRMLAVLADAPVASTDMASLLAVLLEAGRHGCWCRLQLRSAQAMQKRTCAGARRGFTPNPTSSWMKEAESSSDCRALFVVQIIILERPTEGRMLYRGPP
jgi:hypothetical protein